MAPKTGWDKFGKSTNLSKKQVATGSRAGGGQVSAAQRKASGKSVSIGDTKWVTAGERSTFKDQYGKNPGKGGILLNKAGKAVTGSVKLANGDTARYVNGKRLVAGSGKTSSSRASNGGGNKGTSGGNGAKDTKSLKDTKFVSSTPKTAAEIAAAKAKQKATLANSPIAQKFANADRRARTMGMASRSPRTTTSSTPERKYEVAPSRSGAGTANSLTAAAIRARIKTLELQSNRISNAAADKAKKDALATELKKLQNQLKSLG